MAQSKIAVDLILSKLAEDAERSRERVQKASNVLLEPLDRKLPRHHTKWYMKKTV